MIDLYLWSESRERREERKRKVLIGETMGGLLVILIVSGGSRMFWSFCPFDPGNYYFAPEFCVYIFLNYFSVKENDCFFSFEN